MKRSRLTEGFILLGLLALAALIARPGAQVELDLSRLGGELTDRNANPLPVVLQLPAPNITSQGLIDQFFLGHFHFHRDFNAPDESGKNPLGPYLNHSSCEGCHRNDGRGEVKFNKKLPGSPMLIKVATRGLKENGAPRDVPGAGEQLRDHTLRNKTRYNIRLRYNNTSGIYPDGTPYQLRKPVVRFKIPGVRAQTVVSSLRQTPPIVGAGLLEAILDADIEALSDPDDENGDGISGRVSRVFDRESGAPAIGRFGFRASHISVREQSAAAFFNDMGITNPVFHGKADRFELSEEALQSVVVYMQAAAVPGARNQDEPDVRAGKSIFTDIGCADCHHPTFVTGGHEIAELSNQQIHPFTDLLLHDMGPGLADTRPEFSASEREWRTSPLWGIGLAELLLEGRTPGYLHDGRARSLEEAILWHGGEGESSRNQFMNLKSIERERLIKFLRSI